MNSSNNLPSAPSPATVAPASPTAPVQDSRNSSGADSSTNGGSSVSRTNQSEAIQQLYIAYFGRPAEEAGLAYWTTQLSSGAISPQSVTDALSRVDGNNNGTFNPSGNITTEQFATLLAKLSDSNTVSKPIPDTGLTSAGASNPFSSGINSSDIEQLKKLLKQINSASDGSAAPKQALLEKLKQAAPAK